MQKIVKAIIPEPALGRHNIPTSDMLAPGPRIFSTPYVSICMKVDPFIDTSEYFHEGKEHWPMKFNYDEYGHRGSMREPWPMIYNYPEYGHREHFPMHSTPYEHYKKVDLLPPRLKYSTRIKH